MEQVGRAGGELLRREPPGVDDRGAREAVARRRVAHERPRARDELRDGAPAVPVRAGTDDLGLSAAVVYERDAPRRHRLDGRDAEVLADRRVAVGRLAEARRVPVERGPTVEARERWRRDVALDADRQLRGGPPPLLEVAAGFGPLADP